jgi:electron transport complex protein RnfB
MDVLTNNPILLQTLIIGGTGLVCAAVLAIAARFLMVHEDPRIETATAILPGLNCGACGYAGCADYAKQIVLHGLAVNLCQPGGHETARKLAEFMGVKAAVSERQVALVLCKGDDVTAVRTTHYNGLADCGAAQQIGGNGKACRYGCMGLGSCARICPVGAIEMVRGLAVVHPELCISCTRCVATCPRHLIKMVPESRFIHVLCSSHDNGPEVRKICKVGCIACTLCVKAVNGEGIAMQNNLAVIDYTLAVTNEEAITKCPQNTIVKRSGVKAGAA